MRLLKVSYLQPLKSLVSKFSKNKKPRFGGAYFKNKGVYKMEINKRAREIAAEICSNPFYDPDLQGELCELAGMSAE